MREPLDLAHSEAKNVIAESRRLRELRDGMRCDMQREKVRDQELIAECKRLRLKSRELLDRIVARDR
jgi:hypothetical protein